jgi:hypothetical protein
MTQDKYNMKKQTRSLLEELESISRTHDTKHIVERRANDLISSAIHLMEVIERNFTPEQSAILEKKLLIAIKSRDQSKFTNSLKRSKDIK